MMWKIIWWFCKLRKTEEYAIVKWSDKKGFRKAMGGYWGLWEFQCDDNLIKFWFPSSCNHYPRPPLTTHTEPLEVEEYKFHYSYSELEKRHLTAY